MSEIDAIFASKAAPPPPQPAKKKKKKKKSDAPPSAPVVPSSSSSKKRPAPETVVDTSDRLVAPPKRHKGPQPQPDQKAPKPTQSDKKGIDEFKDSRGSGPRRTTEEGWLVYKEDELGIGDQGGDTPLCPFDCDCCF